jgi:hypothetical protein
MQNYSFREYLNRCVEGKGWTFQKLYSIVGRPRSMFWRRCNTLPWERGGKDGDIVKALALAFGDSWSKGMWMAGYNPFVHPTMGLSYDELYILWEIVLKLSTALKTADQEFDFVQGLELQLEELKRLIDERKSSNIGS